MKFVLFTVLSMLALFAQAADTYEVDAVHANAMFKIKHANLAYFYGSFKELSGSYTIDGEDLNTIKGSFTVQTTSVDTFNERRDKHLRSPDFFNSVQFPEAKFEATGSKDTGNGTFQLMGKLTLHGETKDVTFNGELVGTGTFRESFRMGLHLTTTIKRTEFGMDKYLGALSDEVELIMSLESVKQ